MYREAGLLVGALESLLAGGLLSQPLRTELLAGMSAWLATLCEDQNIDDLSFARVAFQFLFSTAASSADLAVLRNAVRDARRLLGDIFEKDGDAAGDDDIRGDGTVQMAAVNAKTVVAVSALAVGGIDALLAGAEWGLSYARALDAAHTDAEDGAKGRAARIVAAVSERTTRAVELLSELLQAIMTGAGAEALLRALTRACKLVLNIAKWYGKNAHAAAPSKEFVALIDLVLGRLTDDAYRATFLMATRPLTLYRVYPVLADVRSRECASAGRSTRRRRWRWKGKAQKGRGVECGAARAHFTRKQAAAQSHLFHRAHGAAARAARQGDKGATFFFHAHVSNLSLGEPSQELEAWRRARLSYPGWPGGAGAAGRRRRRWRRRRRRKRPRQARAHRRCVALCTREQVDIV